MLTVFITFRYGRDFNEAKLRHIAENSRARFQGMPGLRCKLFTVSPELGQARNVYLWDSPEAASSFFTPQNCKHIADLYGVEPSIEFADSCALVRNDGDRLSTFE